MYVPFFTEMTIQSCISLLFLWFFTILLKNNPHESCFDFTECMWKILFSKIRIYTVYSLCWVGTERHWFLQVRIVRTYCTMLCGFNCTLYNMSFLCDVCGVLLDFVVAAWTTIKTKMGVTLGPLLLLNLYHCISAIFI